MHKPFLCKRLLWGSPDGTRYIAATMSPVTPPDRLGACLSPTVESEPVAALCTRMWVMKVLPALVWWKLPSAQKLPANWITTDRGMINTWPLEAAPRHQALYARRTLAQMEVDCPSWAAPCRGMSRGTELKSSSAFSLDRLNRRELCQLCPQPNFWLCPLGSDQWRCPSKRWFLSQWEPRMSRPSTTANRNVQWDATAAAVLAALNFVALPISSSLFSVKPDETSINRTLYSAGDPAIWRAHPAHHPGQPSWNPNRTICHAWS